MGKKRSPAKAKARGAHKRKGRANGAAEETPRGLNESERQQLHFRHVKEYEGALKAKKETDAEFKNVCKRIKAEGGTVDAVKFTIQLQTPEGQARFQEEIARMHEVAEWNGVGIQVALPLTDGKDAVFEEGRRAALKDEKPKPPAHHKQKAAQRWLAGHAEGRAELNESRLRNGISDGVTKLGDTQAVKNLAKAAGIDKGLEQQPATFREAKD